MRWTIAQVADALGARPGPGLDPVARVAGVSIDSRTIRAGELFIAIHGPRHDGHDHVADALEQGAVAAVVAGPLLSRYAGWVSDRCIAVPDTFEALKALARAVREAWGGKLAGVTGSVGKTTTKEILAALLGTKLRVLKSEGNFNNEYGLPLTLFRLEESHQAAVLEMGMSRRGELSRLARIAKPDVGVVTRVAPAHLEFFSSVDEIALAKRELIEGLNGRDSVAVLNADDARVAAFAAKAPGRVLTYGIERAADFRAEEIEDRGALGSVFTVVAGGKRARIEMSLAGRHVIANALAALAAASVWNIGTAEAESVFRTLRPPAMRGELLRFSNGAALINDCYNSSPAALQAMTALLATTPNYRRRILAAGEIFPHVRGSGAISGGLSRAGRLAAGEGLPRRKDGSDRGCVDRAARAGRNGAAGGKALDALLPAVPRPAALFQPAECLPVHHGSHGVREPNGDVPRAGFWPVAHPALARAADWTVHPRGRSAGASEESGNADHGRRADRALDGGADVVVGGPDESVSSAFAVCAGGLRRHWIHRRLREDFKAAESRSDGEEEDLFSGVRELGGRPFAAGAGDLRQVFHNAGVPVSQALATRLGGAFPGAFGASVAAGVSAVSRVHLRRDRRVFERRESDGRPGRAGDWLHGDRGGRADGADLRQQQFPVRVVSRDSV